MNDGAAIMLHFGIQDIGGGAYLFGAIMPVAAHVDWHASLAGWQTDGNIFCTAANINGTRRERPRIPSLAPEKYMCRLLAVLFVEARQIYLFYRLIYCSIAFWDNSAVNDTFF